MAKNTGGFSWRGFINLIAFIAIFCIAIALLIGKIGGSQISNALGKVAEILAYSVTAIAAFYFANSKRHWAYYIIWLICVALIVIFLVI